MQTDNANMNLIFCIESKKLDKKSRARETAAAAAAAAAAAD